MTGLALHVRFRPEPAIHRRATAREAKSFKANGLPCRASLAADGPSSPWLSRFPVERLMRKLGRPLEKRPPDTERGRAGGVVDEVAD
jgi:hypothetical protein